MRQATLPMPVLLVCAFAHVASAQPVGRNRHPTKLEPVGQSLEQLLNGGFSIVSMGMGSIFTLRLGDKWVMCEIRPGGGLGWGPTAQSECSALN